MKILGYPGRPKLITGVPVERPGAGVREKMEVETRMMSPEGGRKGPKPRQPLEAEKGKEMDSPPLRAS